MTITGCQIREARTLLGLTRSRLAYKVGRITTLVIMRAEEAGNEPMTSQEHAAAIRRILERAGVEFTPESVRLRKAEP